MSQPATQQSFPDARLRAVLFSLHLSLLDDVDVAVGCEWPDAT